MAPLPVTPADGVAWITGASSGIGRALAIELALRGWRVAVSARSREPLDALAAAVPRCVPVPLDVADAAAAAAAVTRIEREIGPLALAVLNAGVYRPVSGADLALSDLVVSVRTNLEGTSNTLVPALAAMRAHGRGQIAIVSSVAGYRGLPTSAAYGATKAALINLAESLKFDLDRLGIVIQVVNPGFVDTPATRRNPFPMPHLVPVETAARRIAQGLGDGRFEITFPRRFTWQLKLLRVLPYGLYFPLVRRATGWDRAPLRAAEAAAVEPTEGVR